MTEQPKRGKGRPKAEAPAIHRSIRLTDAHWHDFNAAGGVRWLRNALEKLKALKG